MHGFMTRKYLREFLFNDSYVKYLGLHLDRRLTWHTHIFAKRRQLGLSLTKRYWLLGRKSKLSTNNKLLIYKVILKPIWTYGIQLWGKTSNSNIEILERFQSKSLAAGCPLVRVKFRHQKGPSNTNSKRRNQPIQFQIPIVNEEISRFSSHYDVRISVHPNELIAPLTEPLIHRSLRRYWPHDLLVRF
jgi:hypothetical protein